MLYITTHTQVWDKLLTGWDQGSGLAWGFQVCLFFLPDNGQRHPRETLPNVKSLGDQP